MHQWTISLLCLVCRWGGGEGGSADRDGGGLRQWRHLDEGGRGGRGALGVRKEHAAVGPAREGGEVGEHRRAPVGVTRDGVVLDAVPEGDAADAVDERHVVAVEHQVVDVRARAQPRLLAFGLRLALALGCGLGLGLGLGLGFGFGLGLELGLQ